MHQYERVTLDYLNKAPKKMQFVMELPVSCSELFTLFEGTDTWTWAGIEDVIWANDPPYGAGTKRTIVQGGTRVEELFLVWEQDRRMAFRFEQGELGLVGALLENYEVEPTGDHACRFTWTIAYQFRGVLRLLSPLLGVVMRQAFKGYVKNLKEFVAERSAQLNAEGATRA